MLCGQILFWRVARYKLYPFSSIGGVETGLCGSGRETFSPFIPVFADAPLLDTSFPSVELTFLVLN